MSEYRAASSASRRSSLASPCTRSRWVVERTLAWLIARGRLACDYERDPAVAEHMIRRAAISGMLVRLTRGGQVKRQSRYKIDSLDQH
jgi:hypothetical protein